jgi:hypothetical protein
MGKECHSQKIVPFFPKMEKGRECLPFQISVVGVNKQRRLEVGAVPLTP